MQVFKTQCLNLINSMLKNHCGIKVFKTIILGVGEMAHLIESLPYRHNNSIQDQIPALQVWHSALTIPALRR